MSADLSFLVLLISSFAISFCVYRYRNHFFSRVGIQGYVLLLGFIFTFLAPALGWTLGLSSAFNDPNSPVLVGTGGAYGLNIDYYPFATIVAVGIPLLAICAILCLPKRPLRSSVIRQAMRLDEGIRVDRVGWVALTIVSVIFIINFMVVGWSRLWYSNLSRFEFDSEVKGFVAMKIMLTFMLAFGCLGAVLATFRGLFWLSTLTVTIAALPYMAFASRGLTVLAGMYSIALLYRIKGRWRLVATVPMICVIYLALKIPLAMRGGAQTGLLVAIQTMLPDPGAPSSIRTDIAGCLQNFGQGFGLVIEERETHATGGNIAEGIPLSYYLVSVSPTVSAIDGFAGRWSSYSARFNAFTPYSGLCELLALNLGVGLLFPVGILLLAVAACRKLGGRSLLYEAGLFGFGCIMTLGFLEYQQYALRTAMRFYYAAFSVLAFCWALERLGRVMKASKRLEAALGFVLRQRVLDGMKKKRTKGHGVTVRELKVNR